MYKIKNYIKNMLLVFMGCVLSFVMLEVFLKIYNPIGFRIKGDKIILPVNKKYVIDNSNVKKLDKLVVYRKNSLGLRGEEPPQNFENYLTVVTIGGSTTECSFLAEDKTWTHFLGDKLKNSFNSVWINNAGLEGHSTYGHEILIKDYMAKLKPKVALFLIGINDIRPTALNSHEKLFLKEYFNSIEGYLKIAANHSEVFAFAYNMYRYMKAEEIGVFHSPVIFEKAKEYEGEIPEELLRDIRRVHKKHLKAYETRLLRLIKATREVHIKPVLITQPAIYGYGGKDDVVKTLDLGKMQVGTYRNGKIAWETLEYYNDVTRRVGKAEGVLVVDLAKEMPKSSRYYYDLIHYTNKGAEKVADIIYRKTFSFLKKEFPQYYNASELQILR